MVIDSYAKEGGTFPGLGKEKKWKIRENAIKINL
jgi:hypothetical protein